MMRCLSDLLKVKDSKDIPKYYSRDLKSLQESQWQEIACIDMLKKKPMLKKLLKNHRIYITTDTWTFKQNLYYMVLTTQWIDDDWKLQRRILNFCSVADHKGETLGKRVEECLLEWGIDRIFTVIVDNASSNDKLIEYMEEVYKDWNGVVLKKFFM